MSDNERDGGTNDGDQKPALGAAFRRLWLGSIISVIGSQVTQLALPLAAIISLHASPLQMGLIGLASSSPALIVGLFIGAWVDRHDRRILAVVADLCRAALLGTIPLAAWLGVLRIEQLYLVAFMTSIFNMVYAFSASTLLPSLVRPGELVIANSRLETAFSTAAVVGPPLAGQLVQIMTAPIAIMIDAISFVISAMFVRSIKGTTIPSVHSHANILRDIADGWTAVVSNPILRAFALNLAIFSFPWSAFASMYSLYAIRQLRLSAFLLGLTLSATGPGFLLAATMTPRLMRRFRLGPSLMVASLAAALGALLIPLSSGPQLRVVVELAAANFIIAFMNMFISINTISLRQAITPDHLRGRVNATMRFIAWSTSPAGALLAGGVAQTAGVRLVLFLSAAIMMLAVIPILVSPVRRLTRPATAPT